MADKTALAGKSLLEIIWEELDSVYDQLVTDKPPGKWAGSEDHDEVGNADEWQAWGELRGQAQGLAYAIAVIQQPYEVDVPGVKRQARERYEAANK